METLSVDVILVPEGFELRVVEASIKKTALTAPRIEAIPIGQAAQARHLDQLLDSGRVFPPGSRILLMGLAGALAEGLNVGDGVLIHDCGRQLSATEICWKSCDPALTDTIANTGKGIKSGRLITSDVVVCRSRQKQLLSLQTHADVVDMEGFTVLEILSAAGHQVAILRVVSDDRDHDIPDLSTVVSATGSIQVIPLVLAFLQRPVAACRLIIGSLQALRTLSSLTHQLFGG
jgi:nucleoside phosphorylase